MTLLPLNRLARWPWRHKPLTLITLLVLLLLLRLAWGWWVSASLDRQLSALRSTGQPILTSQIVHAPIPDSDNAWLLQHQAGMALGTRRAPRADINRFLGYPPDPPNWMQRADASEKANATSFSLARQARQRTRAQFRLSLPSPLSTFGLSYLNDILELPPTLADGAIYSHLQGNDDEAFERLLDILHLARSLRHDDFLPTQFWAMASDVHAAEAALTITARTPLPSPPTTRPATPQQIRRLIAELLDEESPRAALTQSLLVHRVVYIDLYQHSAAQNWLIRPLAQRDLLRALSKLQLLSQASLCTSNPAADQLLVHAHNTPRPQTKMIGWPPIRNTEIPRYSRWFSQGEYYNSLSTYFHGLAHRRLTATALAAQLYRIDHGGWPTNLTQLVPAYLASLPADPFYSDGRPIGYVITTLPDGTDRPLLYFDAGRTDIPIPAEPSYGWYGTWRRDAPPATREYRDLTRFSPAPSKKAVNNNPNQPDGKRNNPQQQNNPQ